MNHHIKNLIRYKDDFNKKFVHGKNSMLHLLTFNILQNHLNQFNQKAKQNYLTKKYHVFHLYFITTSTLLILKKRVKC